ncbi:MAG: hypothetical protein HY425_02625 [Candidatus Levybacteria bacterium]|nr:hypothetical protein [Candidatus Levybacteria bacterium]
MDNQKKKDNPPIKIIIKIKQTIHSLFSKYLTLIVIALITGIMGSAGTYLALNSKIKSQPKSQKSSTKTSSVPTFGMPKCASQTNFNFQIDNPYSNDYLYLVMNDQLVPGYPKKNIRSMEVKGTSGRYDMFVKNSKGETISRSGTINIDCSKILALTPTQIPIVLLALDPSITATWKKYSGKDFSFMYPANWEPFPADKNRYFYDVEFFEIDKPHVYPNRDRDGNATMTIRTDDRLGDVDLYLKRVHDKSFNDYAQDAQDIIVDGKIAAITSKFSATIWYDASINKTLNVSTSDKFLKTILSTFKFANQNQVIVPSITLLSPNGGETLNDGEKYTIKWKSANINNIYFSLVNEGKEFGTSEPIPALKGEYTWTVPDISVLVMSGLNANAFKIFIHNNSAINDIRDYSDKTFTIK